MYRSRHFIRKMGQIVNGKWEQNPPEVLPATTPFANWLTKDGSAGPDGQEGFKAEVGRYHLYLNLGCPFAHRAHLARNLKGLEKVIDISITDPARTDPDFGWSFAKGFPRATGDKLFPEHKNIWEVYVKSNPNATARASVPVLFDTKTNKIVSAESADILRQLNDAFEGIDGNDLDLYPEALRTAINERNDWVQTQIAPHFYALRFGDDEKKANAIKSLKENLGQLNDKLGQQNWIAGSQITEADVRAFVVLLRLDVFAKIEGTGRLTDYPNIFEWLKRFYQYPGVADTVEIAHIYGIALGHSGEKDRETDPKAFGYLDPVKSS